MPARNEDGSSFPDFGPDNHIVPSDILDDELWMLLNTYADGEATAAEVLQVEKLLGSHPEISREFSFLKLTSDSVREFTEIDPPIAMTDAIFAATTRRMTFAKRMSRLWAQTASAFGPAPLRLGGAALAAGVIAVVLWSRLAPRPQNHTDTPQIAIAQGPTITRGPIVSAVPSTPHVTPPVHHPDRSVGGVPQVAVDPNKLTEEHKKWDRTFDIPDLTMPKGTERPVLIHASVSPPNPATIKKFAHVDGPKPRVDSPAATAGIASAGTNVEERHMALDADPDVKPAKPVDLGPDVDTSPSDSGSDEVVAKAMPASYEEPPTTVDTVSYKPGSISDKTRNAPPAAQSLYMRTQEAIRRQHEMQQYGGYGKDAFKNIQRGEVGLSLVGGKF